MSKIFKNKYFSVILGLAVALLIGFGVMSMSHIDFSKIDWRYPTAMIEEPAQKEPDVAAVRQPNLQDFASLLESIQSSGEKTGQSSYFDDEKEQELAEDVLDSLKDVSDVKDDEVLPIISETSHKKQVISIHKEDGITQNGQAVPIDDAPVLSTDGKSKPKIAIVIDDMGMNFDRLKQLSAIKAPINFAFLPYAENLAEQTRFSLQEGHELIVHVPMMPKSKSESLGPIVLKKEMSEEELKKSLDVGLSSFSGYRGINNHMGSDFTEDEAGMRIVLNELKNRDLFFLDSKTTNDSVGAKIAHEINLPVLERDVFLDHEATEEFVTKQIALTERVAKRRGMAIAIGHPTKATISVLQRWLPTLEEKGFELVTLTSLLPQRKAVRETSAP